VNLAGEPVAQRWTAEAKRRIRDSRVDGTRRLVEALGNSRARPPVLVSASATGYYGDRGDEVLTENSGPGSDFLAGTCVEWEAAAQRAERIGIRVVLLRIGIVLGRGGALKKMLPAFRAGVGGTLGSGRQWMSWIHIDDLVKLALFTIQHEMSGPVNAVSPDPVTNAGFTTALSGVLHRPAILPVPKIALRAVYGEMAGIMTSSQRVIPAAARKAGFVFEHDEIGAALSAAVSA
jgi:uncharacterized protein (TIGR01777 family)